MRDIETTAQLELALAAAESGDRAMGDWQVQDLDLTAYDGRLAALDPRGALFLGCTMSDALADRLRAGGALVFPGLPDVPFDPWRPRLYSPTELYDGLAAGYDRTPDARVYAWSQQVAPTDLKRVLAVALHDSSIDDALAEYAEGRQVVGVMGGHAWERDDPAYAEAARLGRDLAARGLTVATGGGPGAMEAANLGARLADEDEMTLDEVIRRIARVPGFAGQITGWAQVALDAVEEHSDSGRSLGIPTWFYGHEPPNPFASAVAKYFRNAIREDVLLQVCRRGLVFLPGAAGTVQEAFQAACTNYYAEHPAPMVFVNADYWTRELPVWPLVGSLARGRAMATQVHLVEEMSQVVAAIDEEG